MVDDIRDKRATKTSDDDEIIEPAFIPPEDIVDDEVDMSKIESVKKANKSKRNSGRGKIKLFIAKIHTKYSALSKSNKIALVIIVFILLGAISFATYKMFFNSKPANNVTSPKVEEKIPEEPPKPTTEASKLTGVQVSPELNQLSVTGVMIENSPDARPQAGLHQAGVVFEAIAEGGITRFLALYQESQPDFIGPVRSVRPYYLQWLRGFDAAIAHAGGSPAALAKIRNEKIKDLDQFANGGGYHRVSNRYAPHNLYTSRSSLLAIEKSKGYGTSNFTSFLRKEEKPLVPSTANSITFVISSPLYTVNYTYDATSNSYLRNLGGKPHLDEKSGTHIKPKVVIAMIVPQGIDPDKVHTSYQAIGSGPVNIFQDGTVTTGTWTKSSDTDQIKFTDATGAQIGLNPGQTWISIVGLQSKVSYKP